MNRYRCLALVVAVAALLCSATANAMINPRFTPVHLVQQATLIVSVDLKPGQSKDQYTAAIREVLKGKTELKALRLDLSKAINTQNADALRDLAAAAKPALFFVGEFAEEKDGQGGAPAESRGLLHVSGQWAEFDGGQDGVWALNQHRRQEPGRLGRRHRHAPPGRGLHPPRRRPRSAGSRRRCLEQRPEEDRHAQRQNQGRAADRPGRRRQVGCSSSRGTRGTTCWSVMRRAGSSPTSPRAAACSRSPRHLPGAISTARAGWT